MDFRLDRALRFIYRLVSSNLSFELPKIKYYHITSKAPVPNTPHGCFSHVLFIFPSHPARAARWSEKLLFTFFRNSDKSLIFRYFYGRITGSGCSMHPPILGHRQAVRHKTLTLAGAGSNPAGPAFFHLFSNYVAKNSGFLSRCFHVLIPMFQILIIIMFI